MSARFAGLPWIVLGCHIAGVCARALRVRVCVHKCLRRCAQMLCCLYNTSDCRCANQTFSPFPPSLL